MANLPKVSKPVYQVNLERLTQMFQTQYQMEPVSTSLGIIRQMLAECDLAGAYRASCGLVDILKAYGFDGTFGESEALVWKLAYELNLALYTSDSESERLYTYQVKVFDEIQDFVVGYHYGRNGAKIYTLELFVDGEPEYLFQSFDLVTVQNNINEILTKAIDLGFKVTRTSVNN